MQLLYSIERSDIVTLKQLLSRKLEAVERVAVKIFKESLTDVDDEEKMILRRIYEELIALQNLYLEIYLKYIELEKDGTKEE